MIFHDIWGMANAIGRKTKGTVPLIAKNKVASHLE